MQNVRRIARLCVLEKFCSLSGHYWLFDGGSDIRPSLTPAFELNLLPRSLNAFFTVYQAMNELYRTNIVYFYIISCWKQVLFSCYLRFGLTVVVNFNNARARHMWQLCIPTRESSSCFVLLLLHLWASCSFATPLPRYSCEWSFLWVGRWDPLYKWWLALNNRPWASEVFFQGRDTSGFNTNFSRWGV